MLFRLALAGRYILRSCIILCASVCGCIVCLLVVTNIDQNFCNEWIERRRLLKTVRLYGRPFERVKVRHMAYIGNTSICLIFF